MKLDTYEIYEMVEKNMISEVKKIIKNGIDINDPDYNGCTLLYWAIFYHHEEMALFLLDNGADGSLQDSDGFTALYYTMWYHTKEFPMLNVAKAILNRTPNALHIENKYGNEPLWTAAQKGYIPLEFIEFLLQKGANKDHKNHVGLTPFDVVKRHENDEYTKLLEKY